MAVDQSLLDEIKGFEGYSAAPAWDYKQSSSGYGTRAQTGDENIPPEQLRAVHEQRLQDEVSKAAAHVDSVNPNLPAGARNALISLTYNAGPGWAQSGLGELVRNGDLPGAQARLLEYNKAGGEVNAGLVARRQKEAAWFGGGMPQTAQPAAAPAPSAPLTLAPQAPPIFSSAPQAAPEPQAAQGGLFAQMPAEQMATAPPIFSPPRKQIDLSKLKAALASGNRGLFFGRG
ncbi:lysozyme [Tardiphaga sp. 538_B7_N1_4]|uniref:lysozyme n=1 Tax=Tardiphaga sp. 538_B7_N1_4 TaxID=3240778 RepID=UPI003F27AA93